MKSTLINLIAVLVRKLIGSDLWSQVVYSVTEADKLDRTGVEKRGTVLNDLTLKGVATTAATWLVNLAIEAAVAKLKVTK